MKTIKNQIDMIPFKPLIQPKEEHAHSPAWWFLFHRNELLVNVEEDTPIPVFTINPAELGLNPLRTQFLGTLRAIPSYVAELAEDQDIPQGYEYRSLRDLFVSLPEDFYTISNYASQIATWAQTHQFCGRCGTATIARKDERAMECPNCNLVNYPRLAPSIIVAITKGDKLLMGRSPHWREGWYSVLAGFVEAGETLEACVEREVMEEVGIKLKNIRYFGSQPWPFPNSLMIGFTAEYASGQITPDPAEIEDAQWFTKDTLPNLPSQISIARKLVEWYLNEYLPNLPS